MDSQSEEYISESNLSSNKTNEDHVSLHISSILTDPDVKSYSNDNTLLKNRKEMSFSVYVDRKEHMEGHRRKIKRWVTDDSVIDCQKCKEPFGMWRRKHHCRVCGKIFCYYCSYDRLAIPDEMLDDLPKSPYYTNTIGQIVRACETCKNNINEFNKFYGLISNGFCGYDLVKLKKFIPRNEMDPIMEGDDESESESESESENKTIGDDSLGYNDENDNDNENNIHDSIIVSNEDVQINEEYTEEQLKILKTKAAIYCLNKLREVQYKLPTEDFTPLEKDLLWSNRNYFCGHSKWIVQILKIVNYTNIEQVKKLNALIAEPKKHDCWDTMCTRYCTPEIELAEMMDILHAGLTHPLVNCLIKNSISMADKTEITLYLPFIAFYIHRNDFLLESLLSKYEQDDIFMTEFYWCIHMYNTNNEFIEIFDERIATLPVNEKILKMKEFETFNPKTEYNNIITPIEPNEVYDRLDVQNIKVLDSASKPMILPFIKKDGSVKRILYKSEDIRKDHVVSNLINLACLKLKKANIIDTDVITYKVSPLTTESGLIEIVEDANTIFNITEDLGFTVQNYINESNPDCTNTEITEKFMKSTAIYCIISYLLGFGDRHLDNIMISKSGSLFHIDFSYILGKDPKYSNSKHIKITPEIINVMGGYNSKNYNIFKKYCVEVYNQLRLHINSFMNLLLIVADVDPTLTREHVKTELLTRFEVGESSLEAALHMDTRIDIGGYTLADKVIDVLYKSKNSNLVKSIIYFTDIPNNLRTLTMTE